MEIILLILGVAGLLWAGLIMLRGGIIAGCLVVLLAASCFGHAFYHIQAKPIPITSDRALLVALLVQFAAFYKLGLTDFKAWGKAEYLLIGTLSVLSFSTLAHDWTISGNQPAGTLLFFYGMPFVMYWLARQAMLTARDARWMLTAFAVFGVYLSLTAYAEVHNMWSFVVPSYIGSDKFPEYFGRGRGPFLNPTGAGVIITLALASALVTWTQTGRLGKVLLAGLVLIYLGGAYYTLTRTVWAGVATALCIIVAAGLTPKARWAMLGATCVLGAGVLAWSWDSLTHFKRDRDVSVEDMTESAELRPLLAAVSWEMFQDRPLLGCGFGHYGEQKKAYLSDRSLGLNLEKTRPYVQHNVFLALLTETGLIGAGMFVTLLTTWGLMAWRLSRNYAAPLWMRQTALVFTAFLGAYVVNGMFHDVSIVPSLHMFFFFLAGAVSGMSAMQKRNEWQLREAGGEGVAPMMMEDHHAWADAETQLPAEAVS